MKAGLVIAVVCLLVAPAFAAPMGVKVDQWEAWKATHNKTYESVTDEQSRRQIWEENVAFIEAHNTLGKSYTLAMNHHGDYTHHEFLSMRAGARVKLDEKPRGDKLYLGRSTVGAGALPSFVDWRQNGVVTPVKDQGSCGSCWAFSATGSMEGQQAKKSGKLVSLSEQHLMDCSLGKYGNFACDGGLMDYAFLYVKAAKGLSTASSYPYKARTGRCRAATEVGATVSGFVDIPSGSESLLEQAVHDIGPISVAIDASHPSFQFYSSGVYNEPACSSDYLDHGVLVVGYGSTGCSDYWIVKNSWGVNWGQSGYILMARNANNQCGIATMASYPIV